MLDMFEQKILIEYLINAVEFMKKDPNGSFCLEKVINLIDTINNFYKTKKISFKINQNVDYNSTKNPKKLYSIVADDVIFQLKEQQKEFKINEVSSREKTFQLLQKIFMLNENEIGLFKLFCRNEIDDVMCELLCLAQLSNGHCDVPSMGLHYLNLKQGQSILNKLVDIGLLHNRRGNRGFYYFLLRGVKVTI